MFLSLILLESTRYRRTYTLPAATTRYSNRKVEKLHHSQFIGSNNPSMASAGR
ncbi:hypothetical protein RSAG8_13304, partial [Rhizoctonia solani AG-8 WAC10335]